MVVEDEVFLAMELTDHLQDNGFDVVGPHHGLEDALSSAQHAHIDAAVLDINLRGQKVFPVADILNARGVPFIFLTAYNRGALPPLHAGRQLLEKPFDRQRILTILRQEIAGGPQDDEPALQPLKI